MMQMQKQSKHLCGFNIFNVQKRWFSFIWFGFKGLSSRTSYILNISDKLHDPDEVEREPLSFLKFLSN